MSTTTDNLPAAEIHADADVHAHDHPSDLKYLKIALILGAITAFEVGTYFIEDASTGFLVAVLFPMMIAKFLIVTAYFMHLKYDNPLFRRVFFFGLILATGVFMITLTAFEFWDDAFLKFLR
jgi:cytochrome c oxidase subunit 4